MSDWMVPVLSYNKTKDNLIIYMGQKVA